MVLEKLDAHMQENRYEIRPIFIKKKNSCKWTKDKDIKLKPEMLKLLEENMGRTLQNLGVGKDF